MPSPRPPSDDDFLWLAPPPPPAPPRRRERPPVWWIAILLGIAAAVAGVLLLQPSAEPADETGAPIPPPPGTAAASAVPAAGTDLFVAATGSGVSISEDGTNWRAVPNGPRLVRVAAGGGQFVGVGSSSAADYPDSIYTSTDGVDWSLQRRVTEARLADAGYDGDGWLVIGTSVRPSTTGIPIWSYRSIDGQTWTATASEIAQAAPVGLRISSLAYGNGQWILGASRSDGTDGTAGTPGYVYAISDDGAEWRTNIPVEFTSETRFAWDGTGWGFVGRKAQATGATQSEPEYSIAGKRTSLTTPGPVDRIVPDGLLVSTLTWVPSAGHWLATGAIGADATATTLFASDDLAHWDAVGTPADTEITGVATLAR